ncbi:hypothetical protein PQX77_016399 [Marasmius sp. AFHP31]|nr:hypothetical protein PQX77_016399 [Marasmius sp. AFHP31]
MRAYYMDTKPHEDDIPPTIATISHRDLETIAFKKTSSHYPCESEQLLPAPSIRPNQTLKNVNEIGGSYDVFLYAPQYPQSMGWRRGEELELPAYVRRGEQQSQSERELAEDGDPRQRGSSPHQESRETNVEDASGSSTTSVTETRLPSSSPVLCLPYPLGTESHTTASSTSSSSSIPTLTTVPTATTSSSSSSHPQPPSRPRPQSLQGWKSSPELDGGAARSGRSSHKQSPYSHSQREKGIKRESSKLSQQIYPPAMSSSPSSQA